MIQWNRQLQSCYIYLKYMYIISYVFNLVSVATKAYD